MLIKHTHLYAPMPTIHTYLGKKVIERVKHKTIIMTSAGFFKTDILEGLEGWLKDERNNTFCNKERGMDVLAMQNICNG